MSLPSLFARGHLVAPDREFLVQGDCAWTYREAAIAVHSIARALTARGVEKGTPVAVLSPNDAHAFLCILGLLSVGAVWVPLNARNDIDTNASYCRRTAARLILHHASLRDQAEVTAVLAGDLLRLDVAELVAEDVRSENHTLPYVDPADLAVLMPTGGTTGEPKAARLTHRNFATFVANLLSSMPTTDGQPVHLMAAPMTHAAGFLTLALMGSGTRNVIHDHIDPAAVLATIERERVTHLFLPPTAIYMLLADPALKRHDCTSLRHFVYAGAPMSVAKLREAIAAFGPVMTQTFGQAEAPMTATYFSPEDHIRALDEEPARLASCGRPTFFTELAVLDDAGHAVPERGVGEICVRGDLVMEGYLGSRQRNQSQWHRTGDIGFQDEDGFVYITDRKRDMIISGGFNIYPGEIEQILWEHPSVQDCAVVGVPDEKWGEAVTAVVELKPSGDVTADELQQLVRQRLGGMKTPKRVEFWDNLPRSAVGKVLRRQVRDRFWNDRERAV